MDDMTLFLEPLSNNINRLNAISHNVANINTPGYAAQQFSDVIEGDRKIALKMSGFSMRETGLPLNIAIDGRAFFLVETEQGSLITKNGQFERNTHDEVLHISGGKLLSDSGPVQLQPGDFSINYKGEIEQQGSFIAQLSLVEPSKDAELVPAGDGLYKLTKGQLIQTNAKVIQGAINASNVNASEEMVNLIELSRHTESLQRAANTYHEMLSKGVSDLGNR
ncbi:flagellar hook basal-body protein [Catenovulum sp. SM1970]|uniref:flagellar basal body rod C-terminal domain-containing protein n=1 Tax=Marinifaba aquimaris TaxID=2741323 RepID=UPI0015741751|nr:flagellar basal body rod C-terminal domain-containing protein [Marinifaba aquimaris]NTS77394.1 flagellar hook basal-body protein [Marinifaba aquimaris]